MYNFDPAINYGPNDAGASAVSIFLVFIAVMLGFVLIGTIFGFVANLINNKREKEGDWNLFRFANLFAQLSWFGFQQEELFLIHYI